MNTENQIIPVSKAARYVDASISIVCGGVSIIAMGQYLPEAFMNYGNAIDLSSDNATFTEVLNTIYSHPMLQLYCATAHTLMVFVYYALLSFYSSAIRMLNREIESFNLYCDIWMRNSGKDSEHLTYVCKWHERYVVIVIYFLIVLILRLCGAVESTDKMLSSNTKNTLLFTMPLSVL